MYTIYYKDGGSDVGGKLLDRAEVLARTDRGKYLRALLRGARARNVATGAWFRWTGRDWADE